MKTIRVRHRGLSPKDVMDFVGIVVTTTPPDPAQIQDVTMDDNVNLPMIWPSLRDTPPGYVWMGEVIDGELVESPEPQLT